MKILIKLFAFYIILLCYTSAYAEESYSLCFYNDDTFFVTVYFTKEECLEEAQTDNYILNGVNLSDNQVDFCDDIAEVHILDSTVYCKREYIKVAPITVDHFVFSRTIQRETPLISNTDVGEGGALISYRFTDLYGQEYWTRHTSDD